MRHTTGTDLPTVLRMMVLFVLELIVLLGGVALVVELVCH